MNTVTIQIQTIRIQQEIGKRVIRRNLEKCRAVACSICNVSISFLAHPLKEKIPILTN